MGNYLDKDGLTRFKENMLTEVDKRIATGGGSTSGGDIPTKEEIIEGATRVTDVEIDFDDNTIQLQHPVGEEWVSYTGVIPVGGVPYCGQEVSRTIYTDLFAWAMNQGLVKTESEWQALATSQNGNVPFYSDGDGSTTFRMPSIKGYVKGASSQSEAGDYVAEGLPNIDGQLPHNFRGTSNYPESGTERGGAFTTTVNNSGSYGGSGTDWRSVDLEFHASDSNPIYGNSEHVTPETSTVMFGVYAFGAIVDNVTLDVTTLTNAVSRVESSVSRVESKVDAKLESSTVHLIDSWSNGTFWYRKYSDGWIEQGGLLVYSSSDDDYFNVTVTLPLPFSNTNYSAVATGTYSKQIAYSASICSKKTTTQVGFTVHVYKSIGHPSFYCCGY